MPVAHMSLLLQALADDLERVNSVVSDTDLNTVTRNSEDIEVGENVCICSYAAFCASLTVYYLPGNVHSIPAITLTQTMSNAAAGPGAFSLRNTEACTSVC